MVQWHHDRRPAASQYCSAYAQSFVRFIRAYEAEGVPIYAVTVQNEPGVDRAKEKDPKWHYPSCHWTAEQERNFICDHLGPTIRREGLRTQIWSYDHNCLYLRRKGAQLTLSTE